MKRLLCILFALSLALSVHSVNAFEEDNILLYYSFDRLNGNTVPDDSGNGHDAEVVGNANLVDGRFNDAIHLKGSIVQMNNRNVIESVGDTGELTMECWFFLNDHQQYDGIISIEAPEGDCCEFRTMVNPTFNPFWNAGHHVDKQLANFTFDVDTWYHYVLVADGDTGKIYVNGEFIGEQAENFPLPKFEEVTIYIGAGENPNVHRVEDAIIDEVVLYDKALTEAEINETMEQGLPGVLPVEAKGKLAVTWGKLKSDR